MYLTIAPERPQRRSALEAASKMTTHILLQIYMSVRVVTEVVVVLKGASPAAEGSSLRGEFKPTFDDHSCSIIIALNGWKVAQ